MPAPQPDVIRDAADEHLVSLRDPTSFEAEQYRGLRHVLERMHEAKTLIAVTSPVGGDGKTTTAINLAGALGYAPGARVLVVDLDLRAPSVGDRLGLRTQSPGLVDAILDPELTLAEVVRQHSQFNLWVLPAGRILTVPYELLKSPRLQQLLRQAQQQFTYVIVDTPPLIPVPDSRLIVDLVDGVLLVVAAHRTPRKLLSESLNLIDRDRILGIVFNGDDRPMSGYYNYYGHGYGRGRGKRRRKK